MAIFHSCKIWKKNISKEVYKKYMFGEYMPIEELLEKSGIDITKCLVDLTLTDTSVDINISQVSEEEITQHINDMDEILKKLSEMDIETGIDDSDPENPKFDFAEQDKEK